MRKIINLLLVLVFALVLIGCGVEDAIKKFDEHINEIDVVILDITMPVIDGLEVCKYIRTKKWL